MEAANKAWSLLDEFKSFAFKGNVVDLAVGVIIGAAFGRIVESLVKNLFMPLISTVSPNNASYTEWKLTLNGQDIPYGLFLGDVMNFLLVAFVLFLFVVKFLKWLMRSRTEQTKTPPPLTKDQELLAEIRDLLAGRPRPDSPRTEPAA